VPPPIAGLTFNQRTQVPLARDKVRQPRLRGEGRHLGIGIAAYVEDTGIGPYEGARVRA